jgi:cytochrome P450
MSKHRVEVEFDQHTPEYREGFPQIGHAIRERCPVAWSTKHGGFWVVTGHEELSAISKRHDLVSNHRDTDGTRPGYKGISVPAREAPNRAGFIEMDPPELLDYRRAINPFLSPAGVQRWAPLVTEITRACIDDVIETGEVDFVDDIANVTPAVLTMALLGLPLEDWTIYCEPAHAQVYTPPESPAFAKVFEDMLAMHARLVESVEEIRTNPRPGMIQALLEAEIDGEPLPDAEVVGTCMLLIGGGFDTTTSLTASSLNWLDGRPDERRRLLEDDGLLDTATEEFVRYFTPAQGGGRTITQDCEIAGHEFHALDRVFLSYALCNHDPRTFPDPDEIVLDRWPNRHAAFGMGVHRCIGSNLARTGFKIMLTQVLERMPDYQVRQEGVVRYENIGVINGYQHVPATFTPGTRQGPPLSEVLPAWQARIDSGEAWA